VEAVPLPEQLLIARVRRAVPQSAAVRAGIGDDCAVLEVPRGQQLLVTTDFTLENVHFRRDWHAPEVVGRRCLMRGLSDIAAMGGRPLAAFLSLALPADLAQPWVDRFYRGLLELAREFRVAFAGGDTSQSPCGIQADIVVTGAVPRGQAILRSSARPGDRIYVTGELGGSAEAVHQLLKSPRKPAQKLRPADYPRHFHPTPRLAQGEWLRRRGLASAMIDMSDGLSTDLDHICQESGVGAVIEAAAIPLARVGRPAYSVSLERALHGGEDYELLFTSAKKLPSRMAGIDVTQIGQITRGKAMTLALDNGRRQKLIPHGWEHFRKDREPR
jgi:thiamine-monophosphate kinase